MTKVQLGEKEDLKKENSLLKIQYKEMLSRREEASQAHQIELGALKKANFF